MNHNLGLARKAGAVLRLLSEFPDLPTFSVTLHDDGNTVTLQPEQPGDTTALQAIQRMVGNTVDTAYHVDPPRTTDTYASNYTYTAHQLRFTFDGVEFLCFSHRREQVAA